MIEKLKGFITQARRVLLVASKPDKDDYKQSAKITSLGMVIIGALGFVIFLIVQLIGGL